MPRKPKPAAADAPPLLDTRRIAAWLRSDDEEAVKAAYREVFDHPAGRMVLAHICAEAGVGQIYAGPPALFELGKHHGAQELALEILATSGFDQASAITMVMTDQLEGTRHDPDDAFSEPDPELAD